MKKVQISGVAKVCGTKEVCGNYARVEINGINVENLLADHMLDGDTPDGKYVDETGICKVNIIIEPYDEILNVNGNEMAMEL